MSELVEAMSNFQNGMLAIIIYVFGWDMQLFFEARKKFALNLKPSTDTLLQSADLDALEVLHYLYEIFRNIKVLLLQDKRWWSHHQNMARNLCPETGTTEV